MTDSMANVMEESARPKATASSPPLAESGRFAKSLHVSFEVAILIKGLHAVFEIVSGAVLWFIKPAMLNSFIRFITRYELIEDPHDTVATLLRSLGASYTIDAQHFGTFYLISHGIVNLAVVLLLWRRKLWAYPLGIVVLLLFIAYQILRWTSTHSAAMIVFTVIDIIILALTLSEYARLKQQKHAHP